MMNTLHHLFLYINSSRVASDISRRAGTKLKITVLRLRNPRNKPDLWEEQALRKLEKTRS